MPIYLDHNATTPLDERVLAAMMPYLREHYGNPSSIHRWGRAARKAIDDAREQVAALVNAEPSQVIFTSGGTEANNLALKGATAQQPPDRIAVSAIEHASVLETARAMERSGWQLDTIDVDAAGQVTAEALDDVLNEQIRLVSIMLANNESGVIQDIAGIGESVHQAGALMHSDAVQAAGKIDIDFTKCNVDLMTISSHKIYGPKGTGALIFDRALDLQPLQNGGGHEMGLRAGTENVPGIVGFGKAAELAAQELAARTAHLAGLREQLETRLKMIPGMVIFSEAARRLPNTVLMAVPRVDGGTLLKELDREGIAVSSGSACSSADPEVSHVLLAMGVDRDLARCAVRLSPGMTTATADIDEFMDVLLDKVNVLQNMPVGAAGHG
jgi:cysteine desulfurase